MNYYKQLLTSKTKVMLEKVLADILAPFGMDGWFSINVHSAVAIVIFICTCILFTRDVMKSCADDKEWSSRPLPTKVLIFTKGILGLMLACYIIYLLITWNSWTILTPISVVLVPLVIFAVIVACLLVIALCVLTIYTWIDDMIMYLRKKK